MQRTESCLKRRTPFFYTTKVENVSLPNPNDNQKVMNSSSIPGGMLFYLSESVKKYPYLIIIYCKTINDVLK